MYGLTYKFGVPVEGLHTETGDGVYETCIDYADMRQTGDRAVRFFKSSVKELAYHVALLQFYGNGTANCRGVAAIFTKVCGMRKEMSICL